MEQSIHIHISPDELKQTISEAFRSEIENFKKEYQPKEPEELLTREETANFFKINLTTLWKWRTSGKLKKRGIESYLIANKRYYKKSQLEQGLLESRENTKD